MRRRLPLTASRSESQAVPPVKGLPWLLCVFFAGLAGVACFLWWGERAAHQSERALMGALQMARADALMARNDDAEGLLWMAEAVGSDPGATQYRAALYDHMRSLPRVIGVFDPPLPPGVGAAGIRQMDAAIVDPTGKRVATICHTILPDEALSQVDLWDVESDRAVLSQPLAVTRGAQVHDCDTQIAFSPQGTSLAIGGHDGSLRIFDAATGALRQTAATSSTRPLTSVRFSPDGTRIVVASSEGARVYDATSGQPVGALMEDGTGVELATFSRDGHWVLATSASQSLRVFDASTGRPATESLRQGGLHQAFSADGTRFVSSESGETAVYDTLKGTKLATLLSEAEKRHHVREAHPRGIRGPYGFDADASHVVTVSERGAVQVWDVATGSVQTEFARSGLNTHQAVFTPDGGRILAVSISGLVTLFDIATRERVLSTSLGTSSRSHDDINGALIRDQLVSFTPDGRLMLAVDLDAPQAHLWALDEGGPVAVTPGGAVETATFSPDGAWFATTSDDNTARVFDSATGKPIGGPLKLSDWGVAVHFTDGTHLQTVAADGTLRHWQLPSGEAVGDAADLGMRARQGVFGKGDTLVLKSRDELTLRAFQASTGRPLGPPLTHDIEVRTFALSPDGRRLASASGRTGGDTSFTSEATVRIYDVASGQPVGDEVKVEAGVRCLAFSPDGRWLALGGESGDVGLWDGSTGKPLSAPLQHESEVITLSFSGDSQRLLVVCGQESKENRRGLAYVWDLQTGRQILKLPSHGLRAAAFSPSGLLFATGTANACVRLWNTSNGQAASPVLLTGGEVRRLEFSADGQRLLVLGGSGQVHIATVGGDNDAPPPLARMDAEVWCGSRLDSERVAQKLDGAAYAKLRTQWATEAARHATGCRWPVGNVWRLLHPQTDSGTSR